jgi:hypothetical protein
VADPSTADLIAKLYERLDRAGDKADALRQAKLELIQSGRYAHPFYSRAVHPHRRTQVSIVIAPGQAVQLTRLKT